MPAPNPSRCGVAPHARTPRLLLLGLAVALLYSRAQAESLFYEFQQEGSKIVLATLELASLPATHHQVLGLTFTPVGQVTFGYQETYLGTFTQTFVGIPFVDDGVGGLAGDSCFFDTAPPLSSLSPTVPDRFWLCATPVQPDGDFLLLSFASDLLASGLFPLGEWRIVSEPLPGDYDGNGAVEQADLDLILLNWGDSWPPEIPDWVNSQPTDGAIDQNDLDGVILNWGDRSFSVQVVPESSSAWLTLIGVGLGTWRRRRRSTRPRKCLTLGYLRSVTPFRTPTGLALGLPAECVPADR